jgi:hypothetical protein
MLAKNILIYLSELAMRIKGPERYTGEDIYKYVLGARRYIDRLSMMPEMLRPMCAKLKAVGTWRVSMGEVLDFFAFPRV